MTAMRGEEFLVWMSDDKSSKFYMVNSIFMIVCMVFFFFQTENE